MDEITYSEAVLQEYKVGVGSFYMVNCSFCGYSSALGSK